MGSPQAHESAVLYPAFEQIITLITTTGVVSASQLVSYGLADSLYTLPSLSRQDTLASLKRDLATVVANPKASLTTLTANGLVKRAFKDTAPALVAYASGLLTNKPVATVLTTASAAAEVSPRRPGMPVRLPVAKQPPDVEKKQERLAEPQEVKLYVARSCAEWVARAGREHNRLASGGEDTTASQLHQQLAATELFLLLRSRLNDPTSGYTLESHWHAHFDFSPALWPQALVRGCRLKSPAAYYARKPLDRLASMLVTEKVPAEEAVAFLVADRLMLEDDAAAKELIADLTKYCVANKIGGYVVVQ